MRFDDITGDGHLWAVRYDGDKDNILSQLFDQWNDVGWLDDFFFKNRADLNGFYRVSIAEAINLTLEEAALFENRLLSLAHGNKLNSIFRILDNNVTHESLLAKQKARLRDKIHRKSWLRIYGLKLANDTYVLTGGAIKLTATMSERCHTAKQLVKLEQVRNFLLNERIIDKDGFTEFVAEL